VKTKAKLYSLRLESHLMPGTSDVLSLTHSLIQSFIQSVSQSVGKSSKGISTSTDSPHPSVFTNKLSAQKRDNRAEKPQKVFHRLTNLSPLPTPHQKKRGKNKNRGNLRFLLRIFRFSFARAQRRVKCGVYSKNFGVCTAKRK